MVGLHPEATSRVVTIIDVAWMEEKSGLLGRKVFRMKPRPVRAVGLESFWKRVLLKIR